mmetsp:Transcript_47964/g.138838  ORF Transcript_47964/g.138838 Transcript_47964/m.138838 type:complete len:273 (+) Transcript_47964:322-1140(+)
MKDCTSPMTPFARTAAASHAAMASADCAGERTSMPLRKGPSASSACRITCSALGSCARASFTAMRHMPRSHCSRTMALAAPRRCWSRPASSSSRPMASLSAPWGWRASSCAAPCQVPRASCASRTLRAVASSFCSVGCSSPSGSARSSTAATLFSSPASSFSCSCRRFLLPSASWAAFCMPDTVASTLSKRPASLESCVLKDGEDLFRGSCCFDVTVLRASSQTFAMGPTHLSTLALTSRSCFAVTLFRLSSANGSPALTIFCTSCSALATA